MNISDVFSKEVVQGLIDKDLNKAFDDFDRASLMRSKIIRTLIQNASEPPLEEALKSPMFSFPCYDCKHKGEETPRCGNYNQCGLWLSWAKQQGLIK